MKTKSFKCLVGFFTVIIIFTGCTTTKGGGSGKSNGGGLDKSTPKDCILSKVTMGMPMKQVYDLIGQPSDTKVYRTGKAWIPFYYGSDSYRHEALYKGAGRITFTGGAGLNGGAFKVYRVIYDPNESGYNK